MFRLSEKQQSVKGKNLAPSRLRVNGVEIEIDTGKGAKGPGESQNPHPLINQTPKGCGTQEVAGALRVSHPPRAI